MSHKKKVWESTMCHIEKNIDAMWYGAMNEKLEKYDLSKPFLMMEEFLRNFDVSN